MKIIEKLKQKALNPKDGNPVTIAFLGDSVTQGCFDVYRKAENELETYYDVENAYHTKLRKIMNMLFPSVPLNIINAGISGGKAPEGLLRIERDVLRYSPDLCVVCFGLNDSCGESEDSLLKYETAMRGIFMMLQEADIETILLTPNMICTEASYQIKDEWIREIAEYTSKAQTDGRMDRYISSAIKIADEMNIPVCDCYSKWKRMHECGVDINELLSNRINHPTKEMNWLFAMSLAEVMFK